MVRGHEALPAFDVAPDHESYEFTKLDPSKKEDKVCFVRPSSSIVLILLQEYVEDQWSWDKPVVVKGKEYPWADGKVFK